MTVKLLSLGLRYCRCNYFNHARSLCSAATVKAQTNSANGTNFDIKITNRPKIKNGVFFKSIFGISNNLGVYYHPRVTLRSASHREDLVNQIYLISIMISKGQMELEEFIGSLDFQYFSEAMNHDIDFLTNSQMVSIMQSLSRMKIKRTHKIVRLFEHEIKFRLRNITLKQLTRILKFYDASDIGFRQNELAEILVNRLREQLQVDNVSTRDILETLRLVINRKLPTILLPHIEEVLLNHLTSLKTQKQITSYDLPEKDGDLSFDFFDKLNERFNYDTSFEETKIDFSYPTLCKIFVLISQTKRRPTPLLRAISQKFSNLSDSDGSKMAPSYYVETLNALSNLNYSDHQIISRLLSDLKRECKLKSSKNVVETLKSNDLRSLLRTLNIFRWLDEEIFDNCLENLEKLKRELNVAQKVTLITALSTLNHTPKTSSQTQQLQELISQTESKCTRSGWLEFVWSLAVLGIVQKHHLESVLSRKFYENILFERDDNLTFVMPSMSRLKALLVASKLPQFVPSPIICDIEESLINESLSSEHLWPCRSENNLANQDRFKTTISGFMPTKFVRFDTRSKFGLPIDAELITNSKLRPPLDAQKQFNDFDSDKLPDGLNRCAIVYVTNKEEIMNVPESPIGPTLLLGRLLNLEGYKTLLLPHSILSPKMTSVELTLAIQDRIKRALS